MKNQTALLTTQATAVTNDGEKSVYRIGMLQPLDRDIFPNRSDRGGLTTTLDNIACMLAGYGV